MNEKNSEKKQKFSEKMNAPKYCLVQMIAVGFVCALVVFGAYNAFLAFHYGSWQAYTKGFKFASIIHAVEKNYIGEYDMGAAAEEGYAALIDAVDDRWSYYMTAEEYASYKDYISNEYQGIGVMISKDPETGCMLVESVTEGSPAERAGIVAGDLMTTVAGQDVAEMQVLDLQTVVGSQTGAFTIGLLRADGTETEVTLRVEKIFNDPVSYELLDGNIGYIKLKNFESGAGSGGVAAVEELISRGAGSLIFDVRSNPGGFVSELTELLDYLLPAGDLFVSVDKSGAEEVEVSGQSCVELPMAVLVNSSSYSAAEFFAAALSEYGAAVTVGSATTGKGRSQVTIQLADGSAVHLSTRKYLTPLRVDLSAAGGLVPDVELELSPDYDNQLEAAMKALVP